MAIADGSHMSEGLGGGLPGGPVVAGEGVGEAWDEEIQQSLGGSAVGGDNAAK